MWAILFIIAGIILQKNDEWFNGADTVGTLLFWVGLGSFILWAVITLLMLIGMIGSERSFSRKNRRW